MRAPGLRIGARGVDPALTGEINKFALGALGHVAGQKLDIKPGGVRQFRQALGVER